MILTIGGFDAESTGFVQPEHRLIEVCLMKYKVDMAQPEVHEQIFEYTQRINPERSIPKGSFDVHGISLDDVRDQPLFEEVGPILAEHCNDCDFIVAHNGLGFDFPFLIQEWDRIGCPLPDFEPFDTMTEGRWATPFGEVPSLQKLCFTCGVDYVPEDAHAAKYDVEKMMECFFWGIQHLHYRVETS